MIAELQKSTDKKIYILYVMKMIGYPVSFEKLNDTVASDGAINYFGFAECFSQLVETGNVQVLRNEEGEECFAITEQGINVVDNLLDSLVSSVRRSALAAATRLTSFEKRGASLDFKTTPLKDGRCNFNFTVTEKNEKIFSLSLILETKDQAERIEYNLSKQPDATYKSIMALLSGQADYLFYGTL